ncbi:MAG: phosphatase PAP2 family protein [Planctomycetota bacterium]
MKSILGIAQVVLIAVCVVWYVRLAIGRPGLLETARVWKEMPRRTHFRTAVLIWLSVFLFDLVQTNVEHLRTPAEMRLAGSLSEGFSGLILQLEGSATAWIQDLLVFPPLTWLLTFAYLILFPALLFGMAHAYDRLDDAPRLRMTAYVYALNYLLCLPFYIFFPVSEPWSISPSGVMPLMDSVHPWLMDIVRPMSGLDNCFPSYHCSLTISLILIARSGAPRRFSQAASISGALILLSTVYLGFHWLVDLFTGVLAGGFVYLVAKRLVFNDLPAPVALTEQGGPRSPA